MTTWTCSNPHCRTSVDQEKYGGQKCPGCGKNDIPKITGYEISQPILPKLVNIPGSRTCVNCQTHDQFGEICDVCGKPTGTVYQDEDDLEELTSVS